MTYFIANSIVLTPLPAVAATNGIIALVLSIVFGIIGALALLMIVISGVRYIVSSGDAQATSKAKNGILYACVGLVVAIAAEVIVQFVVTKL